MLGFRLGWSSVARSDAALSPGGGRAEAVDESFIARDDEAVFPYGYGELFERIVAMPCPSSRDGDAVVWIWPSRVRA